ncbi:Pkinase domain-containing protein/LRR_1 domain-containing protein/LRRNT_2 domain-containing protein/LRR_4 domain-containing protein [Cephalotus follicularis]|uniref:non-specific serine/threonine protein kinase n=1 Tax=Cephalotus follicularis TaxID=3775 RepID=A0A1Q3CRM9_CEPFO|nr:Pkinase domain-containing protein/LRR_1 domain-containing protein/LRRNT_2 domain-containing protein/LRR_4 domain-containing protein [Cephalotus follicularis]
MPSSLLIPSLFLLSLTPFSLLTCSQSTSTDDAISLLRFKSSISRDPFNFLAYWDLTVSHCHWYGITCDHKSLRVTSLNLTSSSSSALSGTLSDSVGNLTALRTLSLPYNAFSGQIPANIGGLQFLEVLELQGNNFSGEIPANLIGFGKLRVIDLSDNQLSGSIVIDKCEFLSHLKLSHNLLVGDIPVEIGRCRNLRTLLINGNFLEGSIPSEIGKIPELRVLDVSRNSLSESIPVELANCRNLSVIVLTNLVDGFNVEEFNAFDGDLPYELLLLPSLQILWAPRANLHGRLPADWSGSCSIRVLNLGLNYVDGVLPEGLGSCKNLSFLDLSTNYLSGYLPASLRVPCMPHFNVSWNNISGVVPVFGNGSCDTTTNRFISFGQDSSFLDVEDVLIGYDNIGLIGAQMSFTSFDESNVIVHDFSWNRFTGLLPMFSVGDEYLTANQKYSYRLLLNNNMFNGSLPGKLVSNCNGLQGFSVNLTANRISGVIQEGLLLDCVRLTVFEAAHNTIDGSIGPGIGNLMMLQRLDLRGNRLSGSLPDELGKLGSLKWIFLGNNLLTGELPDQLSLSNSLLVLDLSRNAITGSIPESLVNARNLTTLLLDHNRLSGQIPSSFSNLSSLTTLDLSFNNFTGFIPQLQQPIDCNSFRGNKYLHSCTNGYTKPVQPATPRSQEGRRMTHNKMKNFLIAVVTSALGVLCIFLLIVPIVFGRRKLGQLVSLKGKVLVIFADAPTGLNYDNVVRATGNFSIGNLIGSGGFGSTYKAEVFPGYLVAVKRLSIGRFHGIQQFDAEIRTLGRIRHKNLVTLVGYFVGEAEMFLIYKYLPGGNLETFIHDRSCKNVQWPEIYKIAMDIAQALAYLHYSCVPRIVHRDIKPSNILLDQELNAYLSDFGLARLLEVSETHATTDVAGTFGYVAPEYATTCRVSDKADVYSFGVVLLELMSGKKSLDPSFSEFGNGFNIVGWTRLLIKEGRPSEFFSPELWEIGPREYMLEMLRLASTCTVETLATRPSMKQVLEKLKQLKS